MQRLEKLGMATTISMIWILM